VCSQIKNVTKLATNFNSSFLTFWALITTKKNYYKEKIVALNDCKRMKAVAVSQRPCLTQELTLTIAFFPFGAPLAHTKSSQKEYKNALK